LIKLMLIASWNSRRCPDFRPFLEAIILIIKAIILYYIKPERPKKPKIRAEAIIKLKEAQPIQFGPRRLSYPDKESVSMIIDNLLKNEIVRPSSKYASPIVLTRKKNGEIRMYIDFRALNKIMVQDKYLLPLIEDQLDMLRDKKFFSILDLSRNYSTFLNFSTKFKIKKIDTVNQTDSQTWKILRSCA